MGEKIRIGIVGTGMMAIEHINNLNLRPDVAVTALADPVPTSLAAAQQAIGITPVPTFSDAQAFAASGLVDAVIVCSPNHTHRAVLEPLFNAGLHILCEKPLATTVADARWITDRAARTSSVFWTGMEYRFMPPVARFIERLQAGEVGRLVMLSLREHRFPFLHKVGDWNRFSRNTGGTMVEKCCHFFDLMRLIIGSEAVRVYCSGAMDINHQDERYQGETPDIIDNSYTVVDFANGCRALLDLSMFAEGAEEQEEIIAVGDKARLDVGIPSGRLQLSPRVPWPGPKNTSHEHVAVAEALLSAGHHHGSTYYQHEQFLAAVRGETTVAVTAEDGLQAVAIGVAAETSAREHRVVTLAEILG